MPAVLHNTAFIDQLNRLDSSIHVERLHPIYCDS